MPNLNNKAPWKILVVDDEPDVLEITTLVLEDLEFDNRPIDILTAESAKEAENIIKINHDIALAFVDVVMENEHAGLDFIKFVRTKLENKEVRLIVRTGNPGKAPFRDVIKHLEIDDYKEKTELTADKLETSVLTSLRAYNNLIQKKELEESLKEIINFHNKLNKTSNQDMFFEQCLKLLIEFTQNHINKKANSSFIVMQKKLEFYEYAGTGIYENENIKNLQPLPTDHPISRLIINYQKYFSCVLSEEKSNDDEITDFHTPNDHNNQHLLLSIKESTDETYWVGLHLPELLSESTLNILNVLASQLLSSIQNAILQHQLISAQSEVLNRLCGSVESRSKETGAHIKRVAHYSALLAKLAGFSDMQQQMIREAAPMHDIGKVVIPDRILQKNGPLDDEEWNIIKTHPKVGYDLLKHEYFKVMNHGAIIAYTHHEKWDGTGYPRGLSGENIPLEGRIVALSDVFDALLSKRAYKKSWTFDDVINLIKEESGKHFDPQLVTLFLNNKDDFYQIFLDNPDEHLN